MTMRTSTRILAAFVAVIAAGTAAWAARAASPPAARPIAVVVPTTTAPVTRGEVIQRVKVAGRLGYDGEQAVTSHLPAGILTAVAAPGGRVGRGARLFAVSGTPALLLYGAVPAYRDFAVGMSDGADVKQLERNLVAMGLDPAGSITVDDHFSRATAAAIRRWQSRRGLPAAGRTGAIPLGQVVFLPEAIRVGQPRLRVGASVGPGATVLSASSTTRVVTAQVTTDQRYLVRTDARVLVTLPTGGRPVTGRVTRIGRVATADPNAPAGAGLATVPVTVALRLPAGLGDLEQAPVRVAITAARHRNVLMVPVTALLAKVGGGYQVRVVGPEGRRLVEVEPGLFDDDAGTVEVAGGGLHEGMRVEVPAA
jgi:peptidoglycan hydrolase-like protein with peptidoglycan-binding domain